MAKRRVPDVVRQFFVEIVRGGGRIGGQSRSKGKVMAFRRNIAATRTKRMRYLNGGPHGD